MKLCHKEVLNVCICEEQGKNIRKFLKHLTMLVNYLCEKKTIFETSINLKNKKRVQQIMRLTISQLLAKPFIFNEALSQASIKRLYL